ncbi:hypothetical protein NQ317_011740 [Molorchus minor]|uniref:Uncharacterized protein n=1 Tax=Molorchus minor TaxID=1323400 RepID=A0ABQ9JAI2_9CUCU|nr:hypothetical protein NQ317_011740 [Molorchus minor]
MLLLRVYYIVTILHSSKLSLKRLHELIHSEIVNVKQLLDILLKISIKPAIAVLFINIGNCGKAS